MRCLPCKGAFRDGDDVIVVQRYVTNSHRGDFVGNGGPDRVIHLKHLATAA